MSKKKPKKSQDDSNENPEQEVGTAISGAPRQWHFWKILSIVLFVICIVLVLYAYDSHYDYKMCDENLSSCFIELENAEMKAKDMDLRMEKLERESQIHGLGDASRNPLPEKYIQKFKDEGLPSPENIILNDLYHRSDLIPYNAPGNVAFRFADRRLLYLLSPNRAFANFASNDVRGWLYLSYKVKAKDDIQWKVIESYCPDLDK